MQRAIHQYIENRTFDEIAVGDQAQLIRTLKPNDIHLFAAMSGDVNPTHVDLEYARSSQFREVVGHSMWGSTLFSSILGTEFPGPGTVYIAQSLKFWRPVSVGDTLTVTSRPGERWEKQGRRGGKLLFSESITEYRNQDGVLCVTARSIGVQTERAVDQ